MTDVIRTCPFVRVLLLASVPFWAAHDLAVGSLPGLIADLARIATGGWMLLRHLRVKQQQSS